jgi:hypothetical protein
MLLFINRASRQLSRDGGPSLKAKRLLQDRIAERRPGR